MAEKTWQRLDRIANERGLWQRPRAEVRDELIRLFMPLADQIALLKSKGNKHVDPDDFRQEAYAGLIVAVDRYDPANAHGAEFSTYAGWRIRGQAEDAARKRDWAPHKARAADDELRARAVAGDDSVKPWHVLPDMSRFKDETDGKRTRGENLVADDADDSPDEGAAVVLARLLNSADPTIAAYGRAIVEAHADPRAQQKRDGRPGCCVSIILAERWGTSVEGAAAIVRSCYGQLRDVRRAV